jgi:transcriptional regulator with XRE-family HTH domain
MTNPTLDAEREARRKRLRSLRELLPISQEKLGALAGMSRVKINKIESGRDKMASAKTRDALAAGLGLTRDEFEELLSGHMTPECAARRVRRRAAAAGEGVAK